jgi:predicted amidohydrolase
MFAGEGIIAEDRAHLLPARTVCNNAMTELLALGAPLVEVVRMATGNAAIMLRLETEMGSLSAGMPTDLSVMQLFNGAPTASLPSA